MAKDVLILSATPRRGGNSELLCDEFMRGAKDAGHQVKKICLRDQEIGHCVACDACQGNGGRCVLSDDMAQILDMMVKADAIVMATPVYFYAMNGQMKTLIDRTYARYTKISEKDFYFIMTAAVQGKQLLERTLEGFRGFTSCLNSPRERGVIYGTGAWNIGDIKGTPAMVRAYEMGRSV